MAYSDDAMISVLQKCLAASSEKRPPPYSIEIDTENEQTCFDIATSKQYIALVRGNTFEDFTNSGQIELNRLIEAKKQREIEQEHLALAKKRDTRETRLFWVAICSLLIAFVALIMSTIALCRPITVKFDTPSAITPQVVDSSVDTVNSVVEVTNCFGNNGVNSSD